MTAIAGTFVKMESVGTRKVVRLHIECPIEQADVVLKALGGYPDPANARWVGIAPLHSQPDNTLKGGALAQKAGILSNEAAFQKWIELRTGDVIDTEERAASFIRSECGVTSRAHLDHDKDAARAFREMTLEYDNWKQGRVE